MNKEFRNTDPGRVAQRNECGLVILNSVTPPAVYDNTFKELYFEIETNHYLKMLITKK